MAPKQKITKEQIEEGAFAYVRERGAEALKARDLSQYLHCSTQPIFSNFSGMGEVRQAVILQAARLCDQYLKSEENEPNAYIAMGLGYLRFAYQEKNLFRLLFLGCREEVESVSADRPDQRAKEVLTKIAGVTEDDAYLTHIEMWVAVHGIATMLCTGYVGWDNDLIRKLLKDIYDCLETRFGFKKKQAEDTTV